MVTITMSERFIFERVMNGRFPEKINAKSLFNFGHSDITIRHGSPQGLGL